ncbi:MAG: phospho-N-acetylmuramoyl-pentapeptide-transferase [Nitrospira sp.]|nr:phospho-N-acetylmuramoyl-pentapeptide-transferase [Candidatus Manganitrophaceae bacterium]HIL33810.1 phospho-N-acetylmuramoyl-pentapeptide-transferase [Candidatus Manganitrophaceae bacterium]
MLYNFLYPLHTSYSFFNVFRYITFRTIYAIVTALVISFLIGPWVTRLLKKHQIGEQIGGDGPESHKHKAGTPTMGGVMILVAVLTSTVLWADMTNSYIWLVIFATVGFGLIGFWDDYLKCVVKNKKGLLPRYKFGFQILVALLIALGLYQSEAYSTILSVPLFKDLTPDLGLFYIPFAILVIVGASNAVNLTDGLDGLAVGPVMMTAMAYLIVSYATGRTDFSAYLLIPYIEGAGELAVFCGAIIGAGLGFLWFNAYPADIFMGDVGSLPLGGALGTVAVISKHELLLVLVGGIFVIEALSVIFQVISFKSRGKRVFLMAPIHHHFELKGWQEPKIVVRFWILSIILALLSLSTLKLR